MGAYRLFFSPLLVSSLVDSKLLSTSKIHVLESNHGVVFFADSLQSFHHFKGTKRFSYALCWAMAKCLSLLLTCLEKQGFTFFDLHPDDVLVVDHSIFIFSPSIQPRLLPFSNGNLSIHQPFSRNSSFLSPELSSLYHLPASVSHRCAYYSLASFLAFSIKKDNDDDNQAFFSTPLYWFLKRNLSLHPQERNLLTLF